MSNTVTNLAQMTSAGKNAPDVNSYFWKPPLGAEADGTLNRTMGGAINTGQLARSDYVQTNDGSNVPRFLATELNENNASFESAPLSFTPTTAPYSVGLQNLRERAVRDLTVQTREPIPSVTPVVYTDAVQRQTQTFTDMRERPTVYRGRQQLLINDLEDLQFHPLYPSEDPNANSNRDQGAHAHKNQWLYPTAGYFNAHIPIQTDQVQYLNQTQLNEALQRMERGYDNEVYTRELGAIIRASELDAPIRVAEADKIEQRGGIQANPEIYKKLQTEYQNERAYARAVEDDRAEDQNQTYNPDTQLAAGIVQEALENETAKSTTFSQLSAEFDLPSIYSNSYGQGPKKPMKAMGAQMAPGAQVPTPPPTAAPQEAPVNVSM